MAENGDQAPPSSSPPPNVLFYMSGFLGSQLSTVEAKLSQGKGFEIVGSVTELTPSAPAAGSTASTGTGTGTAGTESTVTLVLKPTALLYQSISIQLGLSTYENECYAEPRLHVQDENNHTHRLPDRVFLIEEIIHVLKRLAKKHPELLDSSQMAIWISHEKEVDVDPPPAASSLIKRLLWTLTAQIDRIAGYYGPMIGVYFTFLQFYTWMLFVPAVGGCILYWYQQHIGQQECVLLLFFTIAMGLWGTVFLEFWKRRNAQVNFFWMADEIFELGAVIVHKDTADTATNANSHTKVRGNLLSRILPKSRSGMLRQIVSTAVILLIMVASFGFWFTFEHFKEKIENLCGKDSFMQYIPELLQISLPFFLKSVLDQIAKYLNKFENHPTEDDKKYYLTLKKFALQFANFYSQLFFAAFVLKDRKQIQEKLFKLLVVKSMISQNLKEFADPYFEFLVSSFSRKRKQQVYHTGPHGSTTSDSTGEMPSGVEADWTRQLDTEVSLPKYKHDDDYMELLIQFGYVQMFTVAYPLAPLYAFLGNLIEGPLDFYKLRRYRRYPVTERIDIGAFYICFEFINFFSVVTNCYMLCQLTTRHEDFLPTKFLDDLVSKEMGSFVVMALIEHVILTIKVLLMGIIPDVPWLIEQMKALRKSKEKQSLYNDRMKLFNMKGNPFDEQSFMDNLFTPRQQEAAAPPSHGDSAGPAHFDFNAETKPTSPYFLRQRKNRS